MLIASPAHANSGNIKIDVYTFSSEFGYPDRNPDMHTYCTTVYADSIQADWGGGDIFGCGGDFVMLHYTGQITFTSSDPTYLMVIADDGFYMSLDGVPVIDDWFLKGCGGNAYPFTPEANHTYELDAWFYEYGGGACSTLYIYSTQNSYWDIAPAEMFLPNQVVIPEPTPEPTVEPTPEPTIEPTPEPTPEPTQPPVIIEPTPEPTEEPVEPSPEPTPEPSPTIPSEEEPTPEPSPSEKPIEEPTENEPEPLPEPEQTTATEELGKLTEIAPEDLTEAEVAQLLETANTILETAEPGSEEYEEALDALMLVAESDDIELSLELAAIPLLGDVAGAVLELFNDLGNLGADMAPEVRERAEETVIAAVIVGQVAQLATGAAMATASSAGVSGRKIK